MIIVSQGSGIVLIVLLTRPLGWSDERNNRRVCVPWNECHSLCCFQQSNWACPACPLACCLVLDFSAKNSFRVFLEQRQHQRLGKKICRVVFCRNLPELEFVCLLPLNKWRYADCIMAALCRSCASLDILTYNSLPALEPSFVIKWLSTRFLAWVVTVNKQIKIMVSNFISYLS